MRNAHRSWANAVDFRNLRPQTRANQNRKAVNASPNYFFNTVTIRNVVFARLVSLVLAGNPTLLF